MSYPLNLPPSDVSAQSSNQLRNDIVEINKVCTVREKEMESDYADAADQITRWRKVIGIATGLVGAGTAGTSGALGAIANSSALKTGAGVTGGASALIGTAGAALLILVEPGAEKKSFSESELKDLKEKRESLQQFLNSHPDDTQWQSSQSNEFDALKGKLLGLCTRTTRK